MKTVYREHYTLAPRFPRLEMTLGGRLIVRVVGAVSYAVSVAAAVTLLFSDIAWFRWLGVFLGLFLFDRLMHIGEGDIPLTELPDRGTVDPVRYTSPRALHILERAYERSAMKRTDLCFELVHELIRVKTIRNGLVRLDVTLKDFESKLDALLGNISEEEKKKPEESEGGRRARIGSLASAAFLHARENNHRFVDATDFFAVLSRECTGNAKRLFSVFEIDAGDLEHALVFERVRGGWWTSLGIPHALGGFLFEGERRVRHRVMNRAWTARPTRTLDNYSSDFTDLARERRVGFLIGHRAEYDRLLDTLARPVNPNALLVGEPGIGKESLIAHLAFELTKDRVPKALFDRRLVSLDLPRLVAGASQDELQERIKRIVDEVRRAGNVILFIPDIHNLVKTSGEAYLSAADALMPVIMDNSFPVVGTTYPREYKLFIEPRSDIPRMFEVIRVEEITESEAEKLLVYESVILERQTKKIIGFSAVKMAVRLAKKYFHNKYLPGSAEELLKGAVVIAERNGEKMVGADLVIASAEEKINVPIHEATGGEAEQLLLLEDTIHRRLVNQEEAVKAVADALRSYRSGLARKKGPIASFLFVGPTGVGKTELAKTLAEILFGSEDFMVRFDMTEYRDVQSIYRFIGSPDGTVRGALTGAVLEKPYSLILLDEFEKAHPDILNLFLQVLDDARLTDGVGKTVDFTNTLVIATSNAHADIINDSLRKGQSMQEIGEYVKSRLVEAFKPELLNRFSRIVIFRDLGIREVEKIAGFQMEGVRRLAEERGIALSFTEEAVRYIAKSGYDPSFGARPLMRVIENQVQAPLAEKILAKELLRGSALRIELRDNTLQFIKGE